jgi:5-enolpyruvylshikimate-3-phosphate synthase
MDNPQYNWVNQMVKQRMKKRKKATKLIDILDEMNLKEDTTNKMVIEKLEKLARVIFDVDKYSDDVQFVSTIVEDLISSPHHRITRLEIERCNNLYKQYKEQVK